MPKTKRITWWFKTKMDPDSTPQTLQDTRGWWIFHMLHNSIGLAPAKTLFRSFATNYLSQHHAPKWILSFVNYLIRHLQGRQELPKLERNVIYCPGQSYQVPDIWWPEVPRIGDRKQQDKAFTIHKPLQTSNFSIESCKDNVMHMHISPTITTGVLESRKFAMFLRTWSM